MRVKKKKLRKRLDKKVFRNSARSTKDINLAPNVPRGGIRL